MKLLSIFITLIISQFCFALGNPKYEIIDMEVTDNLPFVNLQVEEQKAKFMLDTGARNQVLVLDKDILAKLTTIKPFRAKGKSRDITGKSYIAKRYILPKFNIRGISFLQLRIVEDTDWGLSTGKTTIPKDGVIGLELFLNKGIIIDYPQNKLTIIDRKMPIEYDTDNWLELKFKVDREGVSIYTSIDNGEIKRFILDTGATLSIIKPKSIGDNIIKYDCNISLSKDGKCSYIKPKNVKLNNLNIKELSLYLYDFPPEFEADGILGYDFLVDKVIYIDFDKRVTKIKLPTNDRK
jgi:hypothetical protein